MTADAPMVSMDESAMEALGLMLQNKTRHLGVRDQKRREERRPEKTREG